MSTHASFFADRPRATAGEANPFFLGARRCRWDRLTQVLVAAVLILRLDAAPMAAPPMPEAAPAPADVQFSAEPLDQSYLETMVLIKSVFDDTFRSGKDPFFPDSKRIDGSRLNTNEVASLDFEDLTLKGISISPSQRMALINRYTLAEGEEQEIRTENQVSYKVRCVEVRETSVVISCRGQTRELFLKPPL